MAMLSAIRLTKINLYKHIGSVNFWTPFLLALAAMYEFAYPLNSLCAEHSIPANGFAAAFIWSDRLTVFILFLGVFIMFCDLPFKDNQQMFLLSRSGKRTWIFSQVLYVIFVSFVYMAFIFASFCVIMLPNIAFDAGNWGKIIKSTAAGLGGNSGLRIAPKASTLNDFPPLEGFLYAFGTAFAVAVALGLIMLIFNMIVKHNSGMVISGGLIFLYMMGYMGFNGYLGYYFSPLNWISILNADKNGVSAFPDVSWIITVLCTAIAAETAVLYAFGSKKIKFVLDTKEEIK